MIRLHVQVLFLIGIRVVAGASTGPPSKPNIVFIVSDDLGFNDVGFHGSTQIPTPSIDELAKTGVVLNNYHVQPVCSPTRSTFMSGRHVIHTGIYMPFAQGTALRLNLTYTLLPQYLKNLGYDTHMVGKWHLGQNVLAALPTGRGFDTYFGYWSGAEDYYSHECRGAYDLADGTRTAFEFNGTYSTPLWTAKAVEIIEKSPHSNKPFFLYLAYQNVHWPLEAPEAYMKMFQNNTGNDDKRQSVAAMVAIMDEGIGNVTSALKRAGAWESTLLIFSTDNGGPTNGNEGTSSNNFPMRGGKNTIWEGGTRGVGVARGAGIDKELAGTVSYAKFHAADWLPTLVRVAAGGGDWHDHIPENEPPYLLGDGIDVWEQISKGKIGLRTEVIKECHNPSQPQFHGNALIVGDWKILKLGTIHPSDEFGWHPPPGQDPSTQTYQLPCDISQQPKSMDKSECTKAFCLFNVTSDPCEYNDLASLHPDVVAKLEARLSDYQATAVAEVRNDGCNPVIRRGAWRPCDSPDPGDLPEVFTV